MNDATARTAQSIALFLAMVATGFALGGALAHLYELPNKIAISREHYLIVQRNYDGWWGLAYVLAAQLVGTLVALLSRHLTARHIRSPCRCMPVAK